MSDERRSAKDLVLAPNEFAYISDETKGNVDVYVGPHKTSLAGTDQPVIFNQLTKRFETTNLETAKQVQTIAPEGWYVVLKNPAADNKHPAPGTRQGNSDLQTGKKVNLPGPVSFALYPGQMAKVLQGHHIRSNQYLLVRVYDENAARTHAASAVVKKKIDITPAEGETENTTTSEVSFDVTSLTMGQCIIIKGTEVSFYIPPTGMEVVPDERGNLVREAVTLERLDYCLLKDEDGNKRYVQGPAVVFPKPTEVFESREVNGETTRRFTAIELNDNSGIYIKVIAPYEENGKQYKVGDELFITGKSQMIYFPREEHAIVKYGEHEIHFGIAIPAGEARYVLNRNDGNIRLIAGPKVFLPDPRTEVVVRRILDARLVQMLYPDNQAALEHNAKIAGLDLDTYLGTPNPSMAGGGLESTYTVNAAMALESYGATRGIAVADNLRARKLGGPSAKGFAGDGFNRKGQYTEPRTITLNTKFDGAVSFDVWTGYAVKLVQKSGKQRVVVGPATVVMEYDEAPQVLGLSTGKPKTTDRLHKTAFLMIKANKVSDVLDVETRDYCKLKLKLSYRVDFEGDNHKWFDVENYVKFLCDHMRSKVRNAVMKIGIEEFYGNAVEHLRNVCLGVAAEGQSRPGTTFAENGMRIYDVEVLGVELESKEIQNLLVNAQREVINQTLSLAAARRGLDHTRESEKIKQQIALAQAETKEKNLTLSQQQLVTQLQFDLASIQAEAKREMEREEKNLEAQKARNDIAELANLARQRNAEVDAYLTQQVQNQRLEWIRAEVEAVVEKAKAVSPDLIAALNAFGERAMVEKVAEAMAPLSILGGGKQSVAEILGNMLQGTVLAKHLPTAVDKLLSAPTGNGSGGNGNGKHGSTPSA